MMQLTILFLFKGKLFLEGKQPFSGVLQKGVGIPGKVPKAYPRLPQTSKMEGFAFSR